MDRPHPTQSQLIQDIWEYGELVCLRNYDGLRTLQEGLSQDELAEIAWTLGRFSLLLRGQSREDPMLAFCHPEAHALRIQGFRMVFHWRGRSEIRAENSIQRQARGKIQNRSSEDSTRSAILNSVDEYRRAVRKGESTEIKRSLKSPSKTRVKFDSQQQRQADIQVKSSKIEREKSRLSQKQKSAQKGKLGSHPAVHAAKGLLSRFKREKTSAYNQLYQYDKCVSNYLRLDVLTRLQNWDQSTSLLRHLLTDPVMNDAGENQNL